MVIVDLQPNDSIINYTRNWPTEPEKMNLAGGRGNDQWETLVVLQRTIVKSVWKGVSQCS